MRSPVRPGEAADADVAHRSVIVTPLDDRFRWTILGHLLSLDDADRILRFGNPVRDRTIETYVENIDFEQDRVVGAHDTQLALIGVGHLAFTGDPQMGLDCDFGMSVLRRARRRGVGSALFRQALAFAHTRAARRFSMHFLSHNAATLHIARRAGMKLQLSYGESHAVLDLAITTPPSST
jgi:hypothetical protein